MSLYSEALDKVHVDGPRASLVVFMTGRLEASHVDVVVRDREPTGTPEWAFVTLCPAVARLDASARARSVLDVADAAVRELGRVRGWDPDAFDVCRDHVVAHDYTYTWHGAWKSSPDRRHQARASYRIGTPDGFARAQLEVRRRADREVVVSSPEAVAFSTTRALRLSAATLEWLDSLEVGFRPRGRVPTTNPDERITGRAESDGWGFVMPTPVAVRTPGEGLAPDPAAPVPPVVVSPWPS